MIEMKLLNKKILANISKTPVFLTMENLSLSLGKFRIKYDSTRKMNVVFRYLNP